MFLRFLRLICGCVYVMFSGDCPERMLTILSRSRLPFWNIKRRSGGIVVCIYAAHFKRLIPLRRQAAVKVHIIGRRGLPFILRRYRRRSGLAIGLSAFFILNWIASMFIWNIQVEGNLEVPTKQILEYLARRGITEGALAEGIDCDNIRTEMAKDIENISWASLSIEGCRLTVSVHERQPIDTSSPAPCNLVAARDGIVGDIRVMAGKTMVKKGDTVTKGQLLVSGVLEYSTGNTDLVAAKGEIFGFTTRDITIRQPLSYIQTRRTGEIASRSVLSFFGLNIPLYLGKIDRPYEKSLETSQFSANGAYLPIRITTAQFFFLENQQIDLTQEQAEAAALEKMETCCTQIEEYEILSFTDSFSLENGEIVLKRHIQARENIALSENIQIDNANSE